MANEYKAVAKELPISAQKTRLVIDLVRGKDVVDALDLLKFVCYFTKLCQIANWHSFSSIDARLTAAHNHAAA